MKRAWNWLAYYLPESVLSAIGRVPFVVVTRRGQWESEKNAFDLGRDYGRTEMGGPAVPPERHLSVV